MTKECLGPELISDTVDCNHILKLGGNLVITPVRVNHSFTCMEMNVNLSEFL